MRSSFWHSLWRAAPAGAALLLTAGVSSAANVDLYLKATSFDKPLPGATAARMWVFVSCDPDFATNCSAPAVPGPQIDLFAGDSLTVHVKNELPTPASLVIPGQPGGGLGQPVMVDGRVRSFVAEATPHGGTQEYAFGPVRPGTYLYQSGTHPSIQVPMGLYGALVVRVAGDPLQAYPGVDYDADVTLLFSEVDRELNNAVGALADAAVLGSTTIDPASYPSTVNYGPTHFLINGAAYDRTAPTPPLAAGQKDDTVLLRFLNAGLRSHTPTIVGLETDLLAEDGNLRPLRTRQAAMLLAAGKTIDALVVMPNDATYPLFDRMLDLTNDNQPDGGMLAYLQVGSGSAPGPDNRAPLAGEPYTVDEDLVLSDNVLANDSGFGSARVITAPAHGLLSLNPDGTFTYTPNPDFFGTDRFTYAALDGSSNLSAPATATITVTPVNDPPVARPDGTYRNRFGATLAVPAPGVLANDTDVDADTLVAVPVLPLPPGVTLNPDGSVSYNGAAGLVTFSYRAQDAPPSNSLSGPVAVTLEVLPVRSLTLTVRDTDGVSVTDYRWLVEEDTTWHPDPGANPPPTDTLGTNFHRSYMPVVAQGCAGTGCAAGQAIGQLALDPAKHYYLTVLPADAGSGAGRTLGGGPVPSGATALTVTVARQPLPTAQISVLLFEDDHPTNGAPDGNEGGLGGFELILVDAGGRYGVAGGPMSQDAFGQPLRNYLDCFGPDMAPAGVIVTCPDGTALIKNLYPGKYTLVAVPPTGSDWVQTSTIEGTKGIDAWVKAGEPPYFQEFGPPGYHVFIGFVSPGGLGTPSGSYSISGRVTNLHMSRPPDQTLWDSGSNAALAHTTAWVGLNSEAGVGPNLAAVKADAEGNFTISGVPPGTHQLVVWDAFLDQIIAYRTVTVVDGNVALGNVPVFQWFARVEHNVFLDANGDGVRQDSEVGLPEQAVNHRFRDGTVYQSAPTDTEGYVPFDETFPFFNWLVAEVDFTRHRPTGVTVTVDGGGDVAGAPAPFTGVLKPQVQLDSSSSRTETGPVLLEGFQGFIGQTSVFEWGKRPYAPGENGGISGIVYYASTRAEDDPRLAVGDVWEPGVPRVKVRLYRDTPRGLVLLDETETDSWDDKRPEGCPGELPGDPFVTQTLGPGNLTKCYDGLRNFNQVRPAVFDGGYAFADLPAGSYIVEVVPPPGYELVKEEDKNVDFGDAWDGPVALLLPNLGMVAILPDQAMIAEALAPEPGLNKPRCVGSPREVPPYLSLFPSEMVEAPFAGATRPLCDRKEVVLADQSQAAADFFLFTSTPVAGHFTGMILDDLAQEFNPASPQFGEKWAPPFVPVSVRDHTGRELSRVYADQWGRFNGLLPSTFTANAPSPSGYAPAMLMTCMNDPGPIPAGPGGSLILDPQYNPMYSNFCYTFQYMPGTTTYLDTPVLPTAAFASGYNPVDCAFSAGTPLIRQVDSNLGSGPLVRTSGAGRTLTIHAMGPTLVPNPDYDGPNAPAPYNQKSVTRDFGFGPVNTPGNAVRIGNLTIPPANLAWSPNTITVTVPAGATTGQLTVTRGDTGKSTLTGVTVTVSNETPVRVVPGCTTCPAGSYPTIQAAIDAAANGALILVGPGAYDELVVMWKPVRLQGAGAGSTVINAVKRPTEKLAQWRQKVQDLFDSGAVDPLPGQEVAPANLAGPGTLGTEEGAGITVLAQLDLGQGQPPANGFRRFDGRARIDGFTVTGGDSGGGIFVNGWAHTLAIDNNRVSGNSGLYHGGIRVGHPFLEGLTGTDPFRFNRNVKVRYNTITHNGGLSGAGGGLSLATGTDGYRVERNFICGNFTAGDGGGIGHLGLSDGGSIAGNQILFNQSFNQGQTRSGGGIFIGGEPAVGAALSLGAGDVTVDANLVQGNHAGAGHGGGIRTQNVNGADVELNPGQRGQWHQVTLTNNLIVNNVAGWSGAGISLQDTARSSIVNNTIARNDSTATVGGVFAVPNTSTPQPAGISSERHSPGLAAAFAQTQSTAQWRVFSNPVLTNDIVWENRTFRYAVSVVTPGGAPTGTLVGGLLRAAINDCAGSEYWDLGVLGDPDPAAAGSPGLRLDPTFSVLTSLLDYDPSNSSTAPAFQSAYCNGPRTLRTAGEPTTLQPLPALDEGGNWIDVRWGPLTLRGNYHIATHTAAGTVAGTPATDYDGDARLDPIDRGADELLTPWP